MAAVWVLEKVALSHTTTKYTITLKALPMLVCMKNVALGRGCLEAKYGTQLHLVLYFSYTCVALL